ncbi:MAG: pilus assembly protein PilM [Dysgonamonadaceae bacterium]|jgi:cell division protein FtsA|nr:pilus assembly protein PilM [Dysgonamonadaceae bacterium]
METKYVAALDLGTFKLLAMAAKKKTAGSLSILNSEKLPSGKSIRRGRIHNIEEIATSVSLLVNRLNRKLATEIQKIYAGIGGQSLHTEGYSVKKEINGEVTSGIIDDLYLECRQYKPEFEEVLEIVPPEYYLDGSLSEQPKGVFCKEIEARFQLILGRPSLKSFLEKSIQGKAGIEIAGFFISPLATAEVALTNPDKELGCALVEIGAGVTYLSIYKDQSLKYLVTIPLGGTVITKDLCSLDILEAEAERLKLKEGDAMPESGQEEKSDKVIEARACEIVANIADQIKQSGYGHALGAGIILTGGGSLLKNMDKLIAQKTGKPTRMAVVEDHTQACIQGLLALGKEDCAREVPKTKPTQVGIFGPEETKNTPAPPREPVKKKKISERIAHTVEKWGNNLFGDEEYTESNS